MHPGSGRAAEVVLSLHVNCNFTNRSGELSTIWERPKVEVLTDAEPLVRRAIARARRMGGTNLAVDIFDDLACRLVWRARVKAQSPSNPTSSPSSQVT